MGYPLTYLKTERFHLGIPCGKETPIIPGQCKSKPRTLGKWKRQLHPIKLRISHLSSMILTYLKTWQF